jgi:hypothetical protein
MNEKGMFLSTILSVSEISDNKVLMQCKYEPPPQLPPSFGVSNLQIISFENLMLQQSRKFKFKFNMNLKYF